MAAQNVDPATGEIIPLDKTVAANGVVFAPDALKPHSNSGLAAMHIELTEEIKRLQFLVRELDLELKSRMPEDGNELAADGYQITAKREWQPRSDILLQLGEYISPGEMASIHALEHEKLIIVPEKWDKRKANTLARRRGGEVRQLVERGFEPHKGKITVEREAGN